MKTNRLVVGLLLLLSLFIYFGCSDDDDDNPTNSSDPVPSALVGTWWFDSATINGVPATLDDLSFTDTAQTMSITFNSDRTWSSAEYYNDIMVFSQSGTFTVKSDTLNVTRTMIDGTPVEPPESYKAAYLVNSNNLTLTQVEVIFSEPFVIVSMFTKE
jgi:hypothetical protein